MTNWLEVDKEGLAKLVADKSKIFIIQELLQNTLDENVTEVKIKLTMFPGRPLAALVVEDDSPEGFRNLEHAWTLFAESYKKADPEKAGRWNLGEKLVLALCQDAQIITTIGGVKFTSDGRFRIKNKREAGSEFSASVKMTRIEYDEICKDIHKLIIPSRVKVYFNGNIILSRDPVRVLDITLPTVIADGEGNLKPTKRKTKIEIHECMPGEVATIYELGIPVVETGDKWHYNVFQKIPLNMERDNVTPSYLRTLRVSVLNSMHYDIAPDDTTFPWVRDGSSDKNCEESAFRDIIKKRFGNKVTTRDPNDPESAMNAVAAGYNVLHGRTLSGGEWDNFKRYSIAPSSSSIFPTKKPYSDDPNAPEVKVIPEDNNTSNCKLYD